MLLLRIAQCESKECLCEPAWVYGITVDYEENQGVPMWTYFMRHEPEYEKTKDKEPIFLKRCGEMAGTNVTPEESEILTGLFYPASMDRLIEMIHEAIEANAFTDSA